MEPRQGFESFTSLNGKRKLRCLLTGHEILDDPKQIEAHLSSRKYRLARGKLPDDTLKSYEEKFIVPSKGGGYGKGVLYCTLTKTHLNAVKEEIDDHINGRRYKAALGVLL